MFCKKQRCERSYVCKIFMLILLANLVIVTIVVNWTNLSGHLSCLVKKNKRIVMIDRTRLKLDTRNEPNESMIVQDVAKEIPFLPIEDLTNNSSTQRKFNESCASYPSFLDVQIHNDYWQTFYNGNISYYLFGAYLDKRPFIVADKPIVRVLAMIHYISLNNSDYPRTVCQLWFNNHTQPVITPAQNVRKIWLYAWWHKPEHNYPHFLDCPLPTGFIHMVPQTVSLVASSCDRATNSLKVVYNPLDSNEKKQGFAVCVKGLDFPYVDISYRLVEYIEILRSFGASQITMYQLQVHPNITKVLKYYERTGFLEYRPFSLSQKGANLKSYLHLEMDANQDSYILHEVIPYNDCFYRNMYHYKFIAIIDVDEILVPKGNFDNWHDLIKLAEVITTNECKTYASYCFRCFKFPKHAEESVFTQDFPEYFYMLQHVHRVKNNNSLESDPKCFHSTDQAISVHNHFPMEYNELGVCRQYIFEAGDAQLQHYREPIEESELQDPLIDTSLWRFKDKIIERSMNVFEILQFFKEVDDD